MDGAFGSKPEIKETDTHLNSTDGYGQFNWRMKFQMKMPCSFPRMQIMVYDSNFIASDESICSVTIKFDNIIKKLMLDNRYEREPIP